MIFENRSAAYILVREHQKHRNACFAGHLSKFRSVPRRPCEHGIFVGPVKQVGAIYLSPRAKAGTAPSTKIIDLRDKRTSRTPQHGLRLA
jgi:hypothetical protein